MQHTPSYAAGADIAPSIFVKGSAGVDRTIIPCVADDDAVGVSHEGTREAPIPGVTPRAAASGESCQVYGLSEPCEIVAGAAIAAWQYLKPDANGHAVPCAATERYSARATANAAAGEKVKAIVERGIAA